MTFVEMLVAGWIAGWIANSIVSWLLRKTFQMMIIIFKLFALGTFVYWSPILGSNNLNYHKSNRKLMWYKITVEQWSCNNHFDLLFSMEFSFLYFDLLAKSELFFWFIGNRKIDELRSTGSSSCGGTLDGKIIKL